jgi:hypothetical protein
MLGEFHRAYNRLNVQRSLKFVRSGNKLSISVVLLLTVALSSIIVSQEISAQPFSGLRIIVHLFSEPSDRANISIRDNDSDYFQSKNVTTRSDGSAIVEFRAPPGEISIYEPFYIRAESNSSNCGDVSGYNKPAYVPEYVDLYLVPCDLT